MKKIKINIDEFSGSIIIEDKLYNKIRCFETSQNINSTLMFANGEFDGPELMDENGIISPRTFEVMKTIVVDNPSEFLKNNQELAKSVKHIFISIPDKRNL
jgi:hypothetical protein